MAQVLAIRNPFLIKTNGPEAATEGREFPLEAKMSFVEYERLDRPDPGWLARETARYLKLNSLQSDFLDNMSGPKLLGAKCRRDRSLAYVQETYHGRAGPKAVGFSKIRF